MTMQLKSYIIDLIEGRKRSSVVHGALHVVSKAFKLGVNLRNFAFDHHLIKETKVEIPVISIGNIIAGGTGKTALIQKMGKDLSISQRVSVLIRGYCSKIEKAGGSLHLIEKSCVTPEECGDEAYLLWKLLPQLSFFIGKDRCLNAQRAVYHEADVILLDDGMQYRALQRDLEIVMLHAHDLYGNGLYLPRGYLRDSPKRLEQADYVFINHVQNENHFAALKKQVQQKTSAPLIGVQMVPSAIKGKGGETWEDVKDKRVAVFCGLGKPESFFKTVERMGCMIVDTLILLDHASPMKKQLVDFANLAQEKGCDWILCSEKDWVKLPESLNLSVPLGYVQASLEVIAHQDHYNQLLKEIIDLISETQT